MRYHRSSQTASRFNQARLSGPCAYSPGLGFFAYHLIMAGAAGLCVSYFTLSGKLYSPSKKNGLCLAQNRPVAVTASGEHLRYACYPELWGQQGGLGSGINCNTAAGRVKGSLGGKLQ